MAFFDFMRQALTRGDWTTGIPRDENNVKPTTEIGVSGIRQASGYVYEEFLQELQGIRGRRVYREMQDNDATVGALLTAIDSMLRAVTWSVVPNKITRDQWAANFVESILEDMDHTFEDLIAEILTELVFGFSFFECVYKRRVGLFENDLTKRSKYSDGYIGLRKIAPRAQESLLRWEMTYEGDVLGFWQLPPQGGEIVFIPMEKGLLFRTTSRKNNPEGKSVLRNAYTSYYYKKNIQMIEAIAIEREMAGLPVLKIPASIMTDPQHAAAYGAYKQVARDLKLNEQGCLILPSDPYEDSTGKPTNIPMVDFKLMSASGSRHIDTDKIIQRYDQSIARTVLADFLILGGSSRGSFALSKSKTDLFLRSIEGYVNAIAATFNRDLLPTLWRLNGFPADTIPRIVPGDVAPPDLAELGTYIQQLSTAGIVIGGDEATENKLREAAGLPTNVGDSLNDDEPETGLDAEGPVAL